MFKRVKQISTGVLIVSLLAVLLSLFAFDEVQAVDSRETRNMNVAEYQAGFPQPPNTASYAMDYVLALWKAGNYSQLNSLLESSYYTGMSAGDPECNEMNWPRAYYLMKDDPYVSSSAKTNLLNNCRFTQTEEGPNLLGCTENHGWTRRSGCYLTAEIRGYDPPPNEWGVVTAITNRFKYGGWSNGSGFEYRSRTYEIFTLSAIHNIADFATDPQIKALADVYRELYFAEYAVDHINNLEGGVASRSSSILSKPNIDTKLSTMAYILFGNHMTSDFVKYGFINPVGPWFTSDYEPHSIIMELAQNYDQRPPYAIKRKMYFNGTNEGIIKYWYDYVTPYYTLSSARIVEGTSWMLVTGGGGYDYLTDVTGTGGRRAQYNNVLYFPNNQSFDNSTWMYPSNLDELVDQGGWRFLRCGCVLVAMKHTDSSHVLMEASDTSRHSTLNSFISDILDNPLTVSSTTVSYTSTLGDVIVFEKDGNNYTANGVQNNFSTWKGYESPYLVREYNSTVADIYSFDGTQKLTIDITDPYDATKMVTNTGSTLPTLGPKVTPVPGPQPPSIPFSDDFSYSSAKGFISNWQKYGRSWNIVNGQAHQNLYYDNSHESFLLTGNQNLQNYTVKADVTNKNTGDGKTGVIARAEVNAEYSFYTGYYDRSSGQWVLYKRTNGIGEVLGSYLQSFPDNTTKNVELTVNGDHIYVVVDGVTIINVNDGDSLTSGKAGFYTNGNVGVFDNFQLSDVVNPGPTPTATPTPNPTSTPTPNPSETYQAEDATIYNGTIEDEHAGYTGTGFVDYYNQTGSYVEFNVSVASAGNYTLTFRYASGSTANRYCDVIVNGETAVNDLGFNGTGAWTTWNTQACTVGLNSGSNTIRLKADQSEGGPNLDKLDITGDTPTPTPTP